MNSTRENKEVDVTILNFSEFVPAIKKMYEITVLSYNGINIRQAAPFHGNTTVHT